MAQSRLARAKKTAKLMNKKILAMIYSYCTPFVIFQPQHQNGSCATFKCKNVTTDSLNLHWHMLKKVLLTLSLKHFRE